LPPKENALFKRILKCYEQKQYKNGLKFSKQILGNPKYSEHGETLAMKGLTLNCLGRKEEAYEYVKRGLRNDLRSHVCWHVYGLLQRSDKKYDEAIKCYRNALKWDKDNIQILRDLSLLQIQMRDLEGYKETRYQLFQLRPTQRASWIGFAMSYHLLDDFDMALKILEEFRKTQQKTAYDYEHSELLMYQNMVLKESGDTEAALAHLELYESAICDKIALREIKGKYLLKLGKKEDAEAIWIDLLKRNPENHEYYKQLEISRTAETAEEKHAIHLEYQEKFPRAAAPKRLPLNFLSGPEFVKTVSKYISTALRKGVPPIFVDLRPLYSDPEKIEAIEKVVTGFMENLLSVGSFDADGNLKEPPTSLLWTYYYLAQHWDHKKDYCLALELINKAIDHTPTLIELFTLKGKIFKHAGDPVEALKWVDEAQSMDTADRYINCKCAKYLLRANKAQEAEAMCAKFTREGVPAMDNLNEMQCMWFQTECALGFQRQGKWGEALKKCIEIDRHFTEIIEDQFDFHTYCMRKMTLRSYVDLLRLEDGLRSHRFYERSATVAINVYLRLHDKPLEDNDDSDKPDGDLDPSELKKRRNKAKKAKRKAEQEKAAIEHLKVKKELHNKNQKKNEEELDTPTKDELVPEKLARPDDPLEEASKFLLPLQQLRSKNINTHLLAFEIYYRKGRVLLMLQAIQRGYKADPDHPSFHWCLVRFLRFVEKGSSSFPPAIKGVIQKCLPASLHGKTAAQINTTFMQNHANDLAALLVGARSMTFLEPSSASTSESAVKLATNLDKKLQNRDLPTSSRVFEALSEGELGPSGLAAKEVYRAESLKLYQYAVHFQPKDKLEKALNHINSNNVGEIET